MSDRNAFLLCLGVLSEEPCHRLREELGHPECFGLTKGYRIKWPALRRRRLPALLCNRFRFLRSCLVIRLWLLVDVRLTLLTPYPMGPFGDASVICHFVGALFGRVARSLGRPRIPRRGAAHETSFHFPL